MNQVYTLHLTYSRVGFRQGVGTRGFQPPELIEWVNQADGQPQANPFFIDEKCNIFQLGVVLYCMITRNRGPPQAHWPGNPDQDRTYTLRAGDAEVPNVYSNELLELVNRCTGYDPANRCDLDELFARIRRNVDGGVTGFDENGRADPEHPNGYTVENRSLEECRDLGSRALRTFHPGLPEEGPQLCVFEETYTLGLSWQEVEAAAG